MGNGDTVAPMTPAPHGSPDGKYQHRKWGGNGRGLNSLIKVLDVNWFIILDQFNLLTR